MWFSWCCGAPPCFGGDWGWVGRKLLCPGLELPEAAHLPTWSLEMPTCLDSAGQGREEGRTRQYLQSHQKQGLSVITQGWGCWGRSPHFLLDMNGGRQTPRAGQGQVLKDDLPKVIGHGMQCHKEESRLGGGSLCPDNSWVTLFLGWGITLLWSGVGWGEEEGGRDHSPPLSSIGGITNKAAKRAIIIIITTTTQGAQDPASHPSIPDPCHPPLAWQSHTPWGGGRGRSMPGQQASFPLLQELCPAVFHAHSYAG